MYTSTTRSATRFGLGYSPTYPRLQTEKGENELEGEGVGGLYPCSVCARRFFRAMIYPPEPFFPFFVDPSSSFCSHCYPLRLSSVHFVTQLSRSSFLFVYPFAVLSIVSFAKHVYSFYVSPHFSTLFSSIPYMFLTSFLMNIHTHDRFQFVMRCSVSAICTSP